MRIECHKQLVVFFYMTCLFCFSILFVTISMVHARPANLNTSYHSCDIDPLDEWSDQEKWVWAMVCNGKVADLTSKYQDESESESENENFGSRRISARFLKSLLLKKVFVDLIPNFGIQIVGAHIFEPLNLSNAEISTAVSIRDSRFTNQIIFRRTRFERYLELSGSFFTAKVDMYNVRIDGDLLIRNVNSNAILNIEGGYIAKNLDLSSSKFLQSINMKGIAVTNRLLMNGGQFADINLSAAEIGKDFEIQESTVHGHLNLDSSNIAGLVLMRNNSIFNSANLRAAKVGNNLELQSSHFTKDLFMDGISVGGLLLMSNNAKFGAVNLRGANIKGSLEMQNSQFLDTLFMDSLKVSDLLIMNNSVFHNSVLIRVSNIGSNVELKGSSVKNVLNMDGSSIGGLLLMRDGGIFQNVKLRAVSVHSNIEMQGSLFSKTLDMNSIRVNGNVIMRDSMQAMKLIDMRFSQIASNLDLRNSQFDEIDLSGTKIGGQLRLADAELPDIIWSRNSTFKLRDLSVGSIQDFAGAWPNSLDLQGFLYKDISNLSSHAATSHLLEEPSDWLSKDTQYSPQPYEQLAKTLRSLGYQGKSLEVLYSGRIRAIFESGLSWYEQIRELLLLIFIGFGYRIYYTLVWITLFVFIGAFVVRTTHEAKENDIGLGFSYSVDKLLPIIKLREIHHDIDFEGKWRGVRYYFYFHQIMGYVLASFLVAGISGLTK